MNVLKLICLALIRLTKQTGDPPHPLEQIINRIRQQALHNEWEAERLDRIRNPTKYLGK